MMGACRRAYAPLNQPYPLRRGGQMKVADYLDCLHCARGPPLHCNASNPIFGTRPDFPGSTVAMWLKLKPQAVVAHLHPARQGRRQDVVVELVRHVREEG